MLLSWYTELNLGQQSEFIFSGQDGVNYFELIDSQSTSSSHELKVVLHSAAEDWTRSDLVHTTQWICCVCPAIQGSVEWDPDGGGKA